MTTTPTVRIGDTFLPLLDGTRREQFIVFEGPRGTGKTRAILTVILCRALAHPGSRWLLARSTRTRLTETVLATLEEQVFPSFGMAVPGGAGRNNRHDYALPNGSTLIPMGLDDPQRTQSAEFAGIYVAEAVELSKLEDVTALAGSMRQDVPGLPYHQCIVDCNPGAPGHWLNQKAEDVPAGLRRVRTVEDYRRVLAFNRAAPQPGRWKRMVTRHQDNPGYFNVRPWDWTARGRAYLETLEHLSGHLRWRWLDGDWVAAEGTVYPEFDADRHVVTPFNVPSDWPHFVGLDPGYDHPCAILWFALAPNGCVYIVDELYRGGMSIQQHAADIHQRAKGRTIIRYFADPQHAFSQTAQSPKSIASQLRECGLTFFPWPRSRDAEAMVNAVRDRLSGDRLKVFATCAQTIREFQSWSYKRTGKGEVPTGDDQFEDKDNHAMDVVRGVLASGFSASNDVRIVGPPKR